MNTEAVVSKKSYETIKSFIHNIPWNTHDNAKFILEYSDVMILAFNKILSYHHDINISSDRFAETYTVSIKYNREPSGEYISDSIEQTSNTLFIASLHAVLEFISNMERSVKESFNKSLQETV